MHGNVPYFNVSPRTLCRNKYSHFSARIRENILGTSLDAFLLYGGARKKSKLYKLIEP
jgi:hypothetical protein